MLISIIVPMYNVELYIEECLLSCLKQDIPYSEYEIIIINDGSTDNSLQKAEHIASKSSNIKIYSQINSGLSDARNIGLKYAKGKYIWFVDSDDKIRENCLAKLINQCEHGKLELLAVSAANVINSKEKRRFYYDDLSIKSGKNILAEGKMQHCVPFTIYSRSFLLEWNLRFYPRIFHEDSEFSPRAYYYAKQVGFTNEIVYLVTINPNSITRTINYKRSFDCLKVAELIHNFHKEIVNDEYSIFFHNHISLMINNAISNFMNPNNDIIKEHSLKLFAEELYKKRYLYSHLCKSSSLKYTIEGWLFTLFPHYAVDIYRLLTAFKNVKRIR